MGLLERRQMASATGLFNLMRNTGGGIGIAVITTLLSRIAQEHQAMLQYHLSTYSPTFQERVTQMTGAFATLSNTGDAHQMALGSLYNTLLTQASLASYVYNFRLFGYLCFICVPVVWMFRKVKHTGKPAAAH
jgi:DHA2 family multidrug resistance protein